MLACSFSRIAVNKEFTLTREQGGENRKELLSHVPQAQRLLPSHLSFPCAETTSTDHAPPFSALRASIGMRNRQPRLVGRLRARLKTANARKTAWVITVVKRLE